MATCVLLMAQEACAFIGSPNVSSSGASDAVKMLLLYRKTTTDREFMGDTWKSVVWAALRAASDFNNRDGSILPHLPAAIGSCSKHINVTSRDTRSSRSTSINTAYRFVNDVCASQEQSSEDMENKKGKVHVVVGPARSACSTAVSLLAGIDRVPVISYWSTSPSLSNREEYPFFFRTIPDDSKIAIAVADFFHDIALHKYVACLYVADAYGQAYQESLHLR